MQAKFVFDEEQGSYIEEVLSSLALSFRRRLSRDVNAQLTPLLRRTYYSPPS
jgi:hypothetical protein